MGIIRVILCIIFPPLAVLDKGCGSLLLVTVLTFFFWIPGVLAALVISSQQRQQVRLVVIGSSGEICQDAQPSSVLTLVLGIVLFAIIAGTVAAVVSSVNRERSQAVKHDGTVAVAAASQTAKVEKPASPPAALLTPSPAQETPAQAIKESQDTPSFEGTALPATVIVTEEFNLLSSAGEETAIRVGSTIRIVKRSDRGTLTVQLGNATFVGHESRMSGKTKRQ